MVEIILYSIRSCTLSQWRDLRIWSGSEDLGTAATNVHLFFTHSQSVVTPCPVTYHVCVCKSLMRSCGLTVDLRLRIHHSTVPKTSLIRRVRDKHLPSLRRGAPCRSRENGLAQSATICRRLSRLCARSLPVFSHETVAVSSQA